MLFVLPRSSAFGGVVHLWFECVSVGLWCLQPGSVFLSFPSSSMSVGCVHLILQLRPSGVDGLERSKLGYGLLSVSVCGRMGGKVVLGH
jgi:hypothetical protein